MKRYLPAFFGLGLLAWTLPVMAQPPGVKPGSLPPASTNDYSKIFKDDKERNGYAVGMNLGKTLPESLKRSDIDYDQDALIKGFTAGVMNDTNRLTEAQVRDIIGMLQREMRTRSQEKQKHAE